MLLPLGDLTNAHVPRVPDKGDEPGTWWVYYPPKRVGADLMAALPYFKPDPDWDPQYRTMAVGEAARRTAGGPVESLILPQELGLLVSDDPGLVAQEPLFRHFVTRMSAGNEVYLDYDPVVLQEDIDAWFSEGWLEEYPRSVVAVEAAKEGSFVLHVDPGRKVIYVVPESVSTLEVDDAG